MEPPDGKTPGPSRPTSVSTKLERIATLARKDSRMVLSTLAHHIDRDFLREAYRRTRKNGATGVDGRTADEYAVKLEENLQSLLDRFKSETYRAPPVKRVHIPKADGKTRPIGIPTFEDKILQRAVAMILESIYEQEFLDCSYGFRPRRSPHDALDALREGLMSMRGGWVLDVDIKGFFDTLDPRHLRGFLDLRVSDGVLRRTINKWLKAGVQEDGNVSHPELGTPQGGVISPLLANIYLHEVLDKWFRDIVQPHLRGRSFMVRYADDFVIICAEEDDARRIMDVLPKRFSKYGLTLHPEKTKLIPFGRPPRDDQSDPSEPGVFDLLGFRHYWGKSQKGNWVVKLKTAPARFTRALKAIAEACRMNRHEPIKVQQTMLSQKLRGHYGYYGVTGNSGAINRFRRAAMHAWRKWLDRRSQRARMTWERFNEILKRFPLPPAIAIRSKLRLTANP